MHVLRRRIFIVFAFLLKAGIFDVEAAVGITQSPRHATKLKGDSVLLQCAANDTYSGFFEWRAYGNDVGGTRVYSIQNGIPSWQSAQYPAERFQKVGNYGLRINGLTLADGATYGCHFVVDDEIATANVFVVAEPQVTSEPEVMNVSMAANLTCSVSFGGPSLDRSTTEQFPELLMTFGGRTIGESQAPLVKTVPSAAMQSLRVFTRTLYYTAAAEDVGKLFECIVATRNPPFETRSSLTLKIRTLPSDITLSPFRSSYRPSDVITCSAKGYPRPVIQWQPVSGPVMDSPPVGPNLTIIAGMRGSNRWKCTAYNELNVNSPTERQITFTVTGVFVPTSTLPSSTARTGGVNGTGIGSGASREEGLSQGAKIGLGVGLGIGLLLLIVIAVIIICCCIRRRRLKQQQQGRQVYGNSAGLPGYSSAVANKRGNQSGVDMNPARLENSGYGDLGLGYAADRGPPRYENLSNKSTNPSLDHSIGKFGDSFGKNSGGQNPQPVREGGSRGYVNKSYDTSAESDGAKRLRIEGVNASRSEGPSASIDRPVRYTVNMDRSFDGVNPQNHRDNNQPQTRRGDRSFDQPVPYTVNMDRSFDNVNPQNQRDNNQPQTRRGDRSLDQPIPYTVNMDRSFDDVNTQNQRDRNKPQTQRGDRSFDRPIPYTVNMDRSFGELDSQKQRDNEPRTQRGDRSFDRPDLLNISTEKALDGRDQLDNRAQSPDHSVQAADGHKRHDDQERPTPDRRADRSLDSNDLQMPSKKQPVPQPRRSNRSFDEMEPFGTKGDRSFTESANAGQGTADLPGIRRGDRLFGSGEYMAKPDTAVEARMKPGDGKLSVPLADRSFDDSASFNAGSQQGSLHNVGLPAESQPHNIGSSAGNQQGSLHNISLLGSVHDDNSPAGSRKGSLHDIRLGAGSHQGSLHNVSLPAGGLHGSLHDPGLRAGSRQGSLHDVSFSSTGNPMVQFKGSSRSVDV